MKLDYELEIIIGCIGSLLLRQEHKTDWIHVNFLIKNDWLMLPSMAIVDLRIQS